METDSSLFKIAHKYENRKGTYLVKKIKNDQMLVEYETGKLEWIHNLKRQERIVKSFAAENAQGAKVDEILQLATETRSGQYSVYVILCRPLARQSKLVTFLGKPDMPCVYVGQTGKSIEERFIDHLTGRTPRIQDFAVRLMPELYEKYNPISARGQALQVERALAEKLNSEGYTVLGGH